MESPICPLFTLFHPIVPVGTQFRPQTTQICIRVMLLESGPLQPRFCPAILAPRDSTRCELQTDAWPIGSEISQTCSRSLQTRSERCTGAQRTCSSSSSCSEPRNRRGQRFSRFSRSCQAKQRQSNSELRPSCVKSSENSDTDILFYEN